MTPSDLVKLLATVLKGLEPLAQVSKTREIPILHRTNDFSRIQTRILGLEIREVNLLPQEAKGGLIFATCVFGMYS